MPGKEAINLVFTKGSRIATLTEEGSGKGMGLNLVDGLGELFSVQNPIDDILLLYST